MSLHLRNTLGGALEAFEPLEPGRVRMYSCGPTVYAAAHVGNFRSFLFADLLRRYLGWSGYDGALGDEHHRRRRPIIRDGQGARRHASTS